MRPVAHKVVIAALSCSQVDWLMDVSLRQVVDAHVANGLRLASAAHRSASPPQDNFGSIPKFLTIQQIRSHSSDFSH
jgi:hypothetical protein